MSGHVLDALATFVLGADTDGERREIEAHVASCRACAAALDALRDDASALALALAPLAPPPALRDRLLRTVAATPRFAAYEDRVARFLQVPLERARELLARIDDPASWVPGPAEGSSLVHLVAGVPRTIAGFVRCAPGVVFPAHLHEGDEWGLVLQGGYRDEDGTVYRAGDEAHLPPGSRHSFVALPGPELVFVTLLSGPVDFGGFRFEL